MLAQSVRSTQIWKINQYRLAYFMVVIGGQPISITTKFSGKDSNLEAFSYTPSSVATRQSLLRLPSSPEARYCGSSRTKQYFHSDTQSNIKKTR